MKNYILVVMLMLPFQSVLANCDLYTFRWGCDIHIYSRSSPHASSLVYCGNSYGYVSLADYKILTDYHRRSINMVLKINDEYVDSPCIPAHR